MVRTYYIKNVPRLQLIFRYFNIKIMRKIAIFHYYLSRDILRLSLINQLLFGGSLLYRVFPSAA